MNVMCVQRSVGLSKESTLIPFNSIYLCHMQLVFVFCCLSFGGGSFNTSMW